MPTQGCKKRYAFYSPIRITYIPHKSNLCKYGATESVFFGHTFRVETGCCYCGPARRKQEQKLQGAKH